MSVMPPSGSARSVCVKGSRRMGVAVQTVTRQKKWQLPVRAGHRARKNCYCDGCLPRVIASFSQPADARRDLTAAAELHFFENIVNVIFDRRRFYGQGA